jgi:hypothetical protein
MRVERRVSRERSGRRGRAQHDRSARGDACHAPRVPFCVATRRNHSGQGSGKGPIDDDPDAPRPEDLADFGDVTRPCPSCKADVYDDAQMCWKCGHAFSSSPAGPKPWVIYTVMAVVGAILLGLLWRFL